MQQQLSKNENMQNLMMRSRSMRVRSSVTVKNGSKLLCVRLGLGR